MVVACNENLIKINPFDKYKVPKYQDTDRTYLTESEVKKLIALLDKPTLIKPFTSPSAISCLHVIKA
jgi:hypothetical protein